MDDIVFFCPHCSTKLSADPQEAGEEFDCPKCGTSQVVPGGKPSISGELSNPNEPPPTKQPEPVKGPSTVIRIPKKKIIISSQPKESGEASLDNEKDEDDDFEEIGGGGLRFFAVALGTVGFVLCGLSLVWGVFFMGQADLDWWLKILIFTFSFLAGLMGLVFAGLVFLIVRLAERIDEREDS